MKAGRKSGLLFLFDRRSPEWSAGPCSARNAIGSGRAMPDVPVSSGRLEFRIDYGQKTAKILGA